MVVSARHIANALAVLPDGDRGHALYLAGEKLERLKQTFTGRTLKVASHQYNEEKGVS